MQQAKRIGFENLKKGIHVSKHSHRQYICIREPHVFRSLPTLNFYGDFHFLSCRLCHGRLSGMLATAFADFSCCSTHPRDHDLMPAYLAHSNTCRTTEQTKPNCWSAFAEFAVQLATALFADFAVGTCKGNSRCDHNVSIK